MVNCENRFKIVDNVLISFDNKSYPAIAFDSQLHADLARVLQDPEQADTIHKSYVLHISPKLTQKITSDAFASALLKICQIFGSPKFSPLEALKLALLEEGVQWDNYSILEDFVNDANEQLRHRIIPENERNKRKIMIITTSASGGCEAVAKAMKSFIESCRELPDFKAIIIDTEVIAAEHDPVKLAADSTFDSIYHEVVQQANQMQEGLALQQRVRALVSRFIPSTQSAAIKKRIREEKPCFLFSTCQYRSQEVALAYSLGIPIRMIHCDYGIESPQVMDLFGKVHSGLVKWWMPSLEPYVFKTYFERVKIEPQPLQLFEQIDTIAKVAPGTIQAQFEQFGYPVSDAIYRITDPVQIGRLQKKWDIQADEKVVVVEMGKYGVGVLEDIFTVLLKSAPHSINIKYLFVCGKNEGLRQKLATLLQHAQDSALKRCDVYGYLPIDEMNEIRNLATLGGTKLGGATTAEYIKLRKHIVVMFMHPWEEGNATKLERLGLYYHDKDLPLSQKVERCIQEIALKESRPPDDDDSDWKKALVRTLTQV